MVEPYVVLDRPHVMLDRGPTSRPTTFDDINFSGFGEVVAVWSQTL